MDLYEVVGGNEDHPDYKALATANGVRHYDFLNWMIRTAAATNRPWLSHSLIKAINFHAIVGLHHQAGDYRSFEVVVGDHTPPSHYRVQPLMDDFINETNRWWGIIPSTTLAAHALWRINFIHPFVNGNGRTARAVCYFIICATLGGVLPGSPILPEQLRENRVEYVEALKLADLGNIEPLAKLITELLSKQLAAE